MFNAVAIHVVLAVYPLGFVRSEAWALGCVVVHIPDQRSDRIAEGIVFGAQPVAGRECVAFRVGQGVVPADLALGKVHRNVSGKGCRRENPKKHHGRHQAVFLFFS